jgi:hypothetical protein
MTRLAEGLAQSDERFRNSISYLRTDSACSIAFTRTVTGACILQYVGYHTAVP